MKKRNLAPIAFALTSLAALTALFFALYGVLNNASQSELNKVIHRVTILEHRKGVVAHHGNRSPSHLPGPPRGGHRTPPQTQPAPSSPPRTSVPLPPLLKPVCGLTDALSAPLC